MHDDSYDEVPVRDKGTIEQSQPKSSGQQKRIIEKWSREDIEDNYLELYSENIILKQHGRKQEDKIKKMATKLLKLSNDNKKLRELPSPAKSEGFSKRDVDLREKVDDLNLRILELEKENNMLKDKLAVAKQQLSAQSKKPVSSAYSYIGHRIDTGRGVKGDGARTPRNAGSRNEALPRYGHSLLEEAREENAKLHEALLMMEERLQEAERESDHLKDQLRQQQVDKNEGIVKFKEAVNKDFKSGIEENVEIIKLQREIKEKSTKFTSLQLQYQTLEENLKSVKSTNQHLLAELERLNRDLQEENTKNIDLQGRLRDDMQKEKCVMEMQHRIQLLEQECKLLKANNESLMKSALDTERDSAALEKERELRLEIAKLQAAMKGDLSDKGEILDKYHSESQAHEKLKGETRQLQIEFYTLKQQYEAAQEKLKFFTSQSGTDFADLEEALAIIKAKQENKPMAKPEFVENTDEEPSHKKVLDLEAQLADTVADLEKSRNMLLQQYNINKVYKKEVDVSTQRLEEYKKEFESRAEEYARLLDIRQARIKKLEAQLRDVAYGTKPVKFRNEDPGVSDAHEEETEVLGQETLEIERGKNVFEIHVDRVTLSEDAQKMLGDSQPSLFVTYGFHEFEIQTTPVAKGPVAVFKFTSQFKVDMDDLFLGYLMQNVCDFELHQAIGTDYRTLACAKLSFRDVFEKSQGRLYGSATLLGNSRAGVEVVGTLEYSIRFIVPVEQALRLYAERAKALGYTKVNEKLDNEALQLMESNQDIEPGVNHLYVKIERCSDLNSRLPDRQPSPYVVYKFYDFDDYDTIVINNSCNPEFSDNKSFKVAMSDDLDNYLKAGELEFYVFDDSQESGDLSFLGLAKVPLMELTHNNAIRGPYEIRLPDGATNGSISVNLRWFSDYKSESMLRGEALKLIAEREKEEEELEELRKQKLKRNEPSDQLVPLKKETKTVLSRVEDEPISAPRIASVKIDDPTPADQETPVVQKRAQKPEAVIAHGDAPGPSRASDPDYIDEGMLEKLQDTRSYAKVTKGVKFADESEEAPPVALPRTSTLKAKSASLEPGESVDASEPGEVPVRKTQESVIEKDDESVAAESVADEVLDSGGDTTDSEQVTVSKTLRSSITLSDETDSITIVVHSVALESHCRAFKDPNLIGVFVSYKFLDVPLESTETPACIEIPSVADENMNFNFHKVIPVSKDENQSSREALIEMLVGGAGTDASKIRFEVVAEPKQEDGDCEDVGFTEVDIFDLLNSNSNVLEKDFDLQDSETEGLQVGSIKLTVKGLEALKSVYRELKQKKDRAS